MSEDREDLDRSQPTSAINALIVASLAARALSQAGSGSRASAPPRDCAVCSCGGLACGSAGQYRLSHRGQCDWCGLARRHSRVICGPLFVAPLIELFT